MPTIAVEFASKLVTLENGELAKVQVWDTAGQETYRSLTMRFITRYLAITEKWEEHWWYSM